VVGKDREPCLVEMVGKNREQRLEEVDMLLVVDRDRVPIEMDKRPLVVAEGTFLVGKVPIWVARRQAPVKNTYYITPLQ
jgi:hypothetical protein